MNNDNDTVALERVAALAGHIATRIREHGGLRAAVQAEPIGLAIDLTELGHAIATLSRWSTAVAALANQLLATVKN